MHLTRTLAIACALAAALSAQQVGDPSRNYRINGIGDFEASGVTAALVAPTPMDNDYETLVANAPVIWAMSNEHLNGWILTSNNSVDVGPNGLTILGDGTVPGAMSQIMSTDASGDFHLSLNVEFSPPSTLWFVMAHITTVSPDGFLVSQTLGVDVGCPTNAQTTILSLSDDAWVLQSLPFQASFYGQLHNQVFIGSNGYVTFGGGDVSWTESVGSLEAGLPRIAAYWDDLDPSVSGAQVSFTRSSSGPFSTAGSFHVCYQRVAEFLFGGGGDNTFLLSYEKFPQGNGLVRFTYGAMSSDDALVGLSSGGSAITGPPFVSLSVDLSSSVAIPQVSHGSVYELFTSSQPSDLAGTMVEFELGSGGYPIFLNP